MSSQASVSIAALTEDQVSKITGISPGRLRAWDRRGFFVPRYAYTDRSAAFSRIYSFKDVVGLRTIYVLQTQYRVSIQKLKKVAKELELRGFEHWADTRLYVVKGEVHFLHPGGEKVESLKDGQYAMLPVIDVIKDVEEKIVDLKRRKEADKGRIERHKFVARNTWVIAGTRIPVATILRYLDAGFSKEQILTEYPTLSVEDIDAVVEYEKGLAKSA